MKQLFPSLMLVLFISCSSNPIKKIEGIWQGNMYYEHDEIRLALRINVSPLNSVSSSIDFPNEASLNIPVDNLTMKVDSVFFELPLTGEKFSGTLNKTDSVITGWLKKSEFDLNCKVELKYISDDPTQLLDYMVPRITKDSHREYSYHYTKPPELNDGWSTATITDVGIDFKKLQDMFNNVLNENYKNIHSFLIVKNDKLVCEEYFYGFNYDTKHKLSSVTKSVTSSLVGIAIDKKYIKGVDDELITFFPEYAPYFDKKKRKITLHHLLSMTAGIKWEQLSVSDNDPSSNIYQMFFSDNTIEYILKLPMEYAPGEKAIYSSGLSLLLGEIIRRSSATPLLQFAQNNLFDPLGISDYEWLKYSDGRVDTGGKLFMRPRDMAKFGYLYLKNGTYNGKQIISSDWIKLSTKSYSSIINRPYCYHWWKNRMNFKGKDLQNFSAFGSGGQYIFVLPDMDMVIVSTAGNYGDWKATNQQIEMIYKYILPAIEQNDSILLNLKEFK